MKERAFDALAPDYADALADPWRDRFAADGAFFIHQKCRVLMREALRRGGLPAHPLVLDVGCGQAPAVAFLAETWRTVGADVSPEMLKGAPAGCRLVVQEPCSLPFGDSTFDIAFAFCVYHHIERRDHVRHLREIARVLKPGGQVFVFEHNPWNPVTQLIFRRAPIDRGCHMIVPARLRRTFRDAGLAPDRTGYLLFFPERWIRVLDRLERRLSWLPFGGQYFVTARKPTIAAA